MATGDLKNNLARLESDLKSVKFNQIVPLLRYLLIQLIISDFNIFDSSSCLSSDIIVYYLKPFSLINFMLIIQLFNINVIVFLMEKLQVYFHFYTIFCLIIHHFFFNILQIEIMIFTEKRIRDLLKPFILVG